MKKHVTYKFGERLKIAGIAVKGKLSQDLCEHLTATIVDKIGLKCIPGLIKYSYPYEGGGGSGYTLIQPITESMITWDVWTDYSGGYLLIVSCKDFKIKKVTDILQHTKLKVIDCQVLSLSLKEKDGCEIQG
jgi:hypothetical protein